VSHVGWVLSNEYSRTPTEDIETSTSTRAALARQLAWMPGITLAILCYLIAACPACVGFLISLIIVYHATFAVNSINHLFGSRDTPRRTTAEQLVRA